MSLAFKEMRMDQIRCREWRHVTRLQEDEVDQVRMKRKIMSVAISKMGVDQLTDIK
jgi:hypothetical protein